MDETTSPQLKLKVPDFMAQETGSEFQTPPLYLSQHKKSREVNHSERPNSATQ
jgi:hypothetical protein